MTTAEEIPLDAFARALLEDDVMALWERAPCGYLSTTPDGLILRVNQTFLAMTGHAAGDLVGRRTFAQLLTPGGRIYHETHFAPMLRMQGAAREIALEMVCADGRRRPVLVTSVLERDGDGRPVAVRTAVFDATERRRYEEELRLAKERAEASEGRALELAATLRETLMPPAPPTIPGLRVGASYRPAGSAVEVGGDFYDVFEVGRDDWIVVVGDVRGKGPAAAVVTALARYAIRAAAVQSPSPAAMLVTLNEVVLRHATTRFCTVVVVRLRRTAGVWTATVAAGGHPLPLRVGPPGSGPGGGSAVATSGVHGTVIGILDEIEVSDVDVVLEPGDRLVLFTDGVTEGRQGSDLYGDDRLEQLVARHPSGEIDVVGAIVDDVLAFQGGEGRDDIVVVAIGVPRPEGTERHED